MPVPSCPELLFQSEAKCKAIDIKVTFYSYANKLIFTRKVYTQGAFDRENWI